MSADKPDDKEMADRFPPMGFRPDGTSMITPPGEKPESVLPTVIPDGVDDEDEDQVDGLAEAYAEFFGEADDEDEDE